MSLFGTDDPVFLSAHDLVESPRIQEVTSSKSLVAYTVKKYSVEDKAAVTDLYIHNASTLTNKQMTRMEKGHVVANPVFALDLPGAEDAILYLKKDGQIWSLPLDGGEGVQVSSFPVGVEAFKIFRGDQSKIWLLCVLSVFPTKSPAETVAQDEEIAKEGSSGMVFDNLMVRHWDTWGCYSKRNHLFVCPLSVTSDGHLSADTNELIDLMLGLETDCPPKPFGGSEEFTVCPDGQTIAFASRRWDPVTGKQPTDMAWSTEVSIFTFDMSQLDAQPNILCRQEGAPFGTHFTLISQEENRAMHTQPRFSPDGSSIAYLAMQHAQYESDRLEVVIFNLTTKSYSRVTNDVDISFNFIMWDTNYVADPTGNGCQTHAIIATAQHHGANKIFRLLVASAPPGEPLGSAESVTLKSLSVLPGCESRSAPTLVSSHGQPHLRSLHGMYFLEGSLSSPNMLKMVDDDVFEDMPIGDVHAGYAAGAVPLETIFVRSIREIYCPCPEYYNGDITMPKVTNYYFPSRMEDGSLNHEDLCHMFYLPPVQLQSEEEEAAAPPSSFPLVLIVHGGPQSAIINAWNYRWNLSFYASRGYGVVAVNFHGSTGFGQAYCDSIKTDWGGQPYRDVMEGVEYILQQKHYLDGTRVGAMGASYGGFMMNWINGHNDRFKCLVNHDGIFNLKSLYFSTEEQWFPEWEFGLPWEHHGTGSCRGSDEYDKWNPAEFVSEWNTPTLVIQGGIDHRIVESEGISTFVALQRRNIPSQFLFFPDENHWCLKPMNSIKWHNTVEAWLKKWLQQE